MMAKRVEEKKGDGYDTDLVHSLVGRIEGLFGDLLSEQGTYMARCRNIRESIAGVYEEAKVRGVPKKELKKVIETRKLEAKIRSLYEDLETESQEAFDQIMDALGDYADTPLGQAAVTKAETKGKASGRGKGGKKAAAAAKSVDDVDDSIPSDDDERDLRPNHLKENEKLAGENAERLTRISPLN